MFYHNFDIYLPAIHNDPSSQTKLAQRVTEDVISADRIRQ